MRRIVLLAFMAAFAVGCALADEVQLVKNPLGWQMIVNGKPFWIQGVGCNQARGEKGEDYLRMAKEMGANAVRTWGGATRSYLDQAAANGLKVNLGIWFNPIRGSMNESYLDPDHRQRMRESALAYVRQMKDHPALLLWNVGNEVFAFTEKPEERRAFGEFLESLIREIHKTDPSHPVVYASSAARDLPDLQAYVPSLDIVGVNVYGALGPALGWMRENAYDRPVLASEFGPLGSWDTATDRNGIPYDPFDQLKADNYVSIWRQIEAAKGRTLGGFAFTLGEQRNQDSLTWFNMNFGDLRRASYWALYAVYTGRQAKHSPPKITQFRVDKFTGLSSGERFEVFVSAQDAGGKPLRYSYFVTNIATDPILLIPPTFYPVEAEEISPGSAHLRAPLEPGIYRVYAAVENSYNNVAIADRSLRVVPR
jgi:hypothetical protein